MHIPMPLTILTAAGDLPGPVYRFYLNRIGINAIELPNETVEAQIGGTLRLEFLNRGAPIHVTISSPNASMYTDFFHENLYIVDETQLKIPIHGGVNEGFFDMEIITGYGGMGGMKTSFRVTVRHGIPKLRSPVATELPIQPVAHGRPHLLMMTLGIALILYTGWLYTRIEILNLVSFIVLIVGALFTWYRQA